MHLGFFQLSQQALGVGDGATPWAPTVGEEAEVTFSQLTL